MNNGKEIAGLHKKSRPLLGAIVWTIIWVVLFPLFYIGAMLSDLIFNTHNLGWIGNSVIILSLMQPLSSIVTIICIWIFYFRKKISHMYTSNIIPFVTFHVVYFMNSLLLVVSEALR